ncbi:MAG TPA: hypothetical protein DCG34_09545 [Clostridiales bacterium]|jgi:ankyrin repeat protein|nr:hypothetical protein [Clostridiales bacterium]
MQKFIVLALIASLLWGCSGWYESKLEKAGISFDVDSLLVQIEQDNIDNVRLFMKAEMDVNSQNSSGISPLMVAAKNEKLEILSYLLESGAGLELKDKRGYTALRYAVNASRQSTLLELIKAGADVLTKDLESISAIEVAILNRDKGALTQLMQEKPNLSFLDDVDGNGLLWQALKEQDYSYKLFLFLVECGVPPNERDKKNETPLFFFARKPHQQNVIISLVRAGAEPNLKNSEGLTPLWAALENPSNVVTNVKALLEGGANPDIKSPDWSRGHNDIWSQNQRGLGRKDHFGRNAGWDADTALTYTLSETSPYFQNIVVPLLIEAGADVNTPEINGLTPLMILCYKNQSSTEELARIDLLLASGAKVNAQRYYFLDETGKMRTKMTGVPENGAAPGQTALLLATSKGNSNAVEKLISFGADVNIYDVKKVTPLHYASNLGDVRLVQLLLAAGGDPNASTAGGQTPVMLAMTHGKADVIEVLIEKGGELPIGEGIGIHLLDATSRAENLSTLLKSGNVEVNATDKEGTTLLMKSLESNKFKNAKELILQGANVEIVSKKGFWALAYAARKNQVELIEMILERYGDETLRQSHLDRALDLAADQGAIDAIKFLLKKGAEVNPVLNGESMMTPLMGASGSGSLEAVKLLVEAGANLNVTKYHGKTAKTFAKENEHKEIVAYFNKIGAK